ncbi:MAG: hypothetical protein K0U98_15760 [Deltaproteobacteria bacterium]|nr:hypothetical protein [Deltaproteobacteria bacterium]
MQPVKHEPLILALDGHDGAGKTTLARRLAEELDAPYVYPFTGSQGSRILTAAEAGEHEESQTIALHLLRQACDRNPHPILVFDRHWMTVFTLLPEAFWEEWQPLPATTLCWADLDTTLERLGARDEKAMPQSWHRYYIDLYLRLAERFSINVLETHRMTEDEAAERVLLWARDKIGRHG